MIELFLSNNDAPLALVVMSEDKSVGWVKLGGC